MTIVAQNFSVTNHCCFAVMLASLLSIAGCDPVGSTTAEIGDGSMLLAAPEFLQTRAVDENNLEARVSVTGVEQPFVLTRNGDNWSG